MTEGRHYGGIKYRNKRNQGHRGRNSLIGTVITLIAGAVAKDITSDDSRIKKLFNRIIQSKQIEEKPKEKRVIDAEFSVINNETIEIQGEMNE